ncbi:retention module-containing protein, partial [Vibrio genomosp. F10]
MTIEDDLQIMQGNNLTITEPSASEVSSGSNAANPSTETIELISAQGADGATITKFTFGGGDSIALDPAISGEQSFDFDEGTLYITLSGELHFEPNRDLDHSGGDITKSIVVTSSDGDKDEVTATVSLTIEDGANPEITEVPTVSLSESALADGSAPNGTPASASVVSSSASITYTEGSDDIKHFEIAISDFNPDDTLKSNGLVVKLRENSEDSGEYLGFTVDSSNQETPVFTLTFDNYGDANSSDKGLYTFTLIEALDHQDGSDKNTVGFVLPIYAVDTDGDVSAKKSLSVTIEDDVQTMQGSSLTISEPNADELASGARPSTDSIELISSQSADGATITQFTFGDSDPISLNPTVLGEQSFNFDEGTVFITLTGELRFEPNRDLDHVNGDIKKSIVVTSSDADKDLATATVELTIKDGQDPEITEIPVVSLSESALADGSAPNGTPVSSSTVSSSASISYAEGGDDIKHFKLATSDFNSDETLTSNGLVVKLREEPDDSGEYLGFTEGPLGQQTPVFTLKFDNYGDADSTDKGRYTFTLIEAFDHAFVQGSNLLNFVLPVYAVDTDGGVSDEKNLSVTIKDDVQTMQGSSLTITEPSLDDLSVGAANPTTDTIELISAQSADGATITQFTFGGGDAISLNPTVSGEQSFDFDEGTLFITVSGELRFEPNRDLDHSGGDITKSIVVTSSDADKDVVTATVELTIKDGQLPEITEIPGVLLFESVLADGSEPNSALVSRTE